MPRFEFDPGYGSRADPRLLLLLLPFAVALVADQAALFVQRSVFPLAGEIGGPLAPGWLLWPGMLFGLYVVVSFLVVRSRTFPFIGDYLARFLTGRHGVLTMVALLATILASLYGLFAFWHADGKALTRHPDVWSPAQTYVWSDVRAATLMCGGRFISPVALVVVLPDGARVDLGSAGEAALRAEFAAISAGIGKVQLGLGRIRTCPAFLSDFISAHRSSIK